MQKSYSFEKSRYDFKVVYIGYFMVLLVVFLGVLYIMRPTQYVLLFGMIIAIYGALNTFVFNCYPRDIVVDDDAISFVSFGKANYNIEEIKIFLIKEFANAQFYIRVEDRGGKRGRYWVNHYYFSNRAELLNELYFIEKKVHPQGLKFMGRENMFNQRPCNERQIT